MARQPYIEIEYLPSNTSLEYESAQENNVSRLERLGGGSSERGFKGLYLNGGQMAIPQDIGTLLNGEYFLFPDNGYPGWNGDTLSGTTDTGNGYSFSTPQKIKITSQSGANIKVITIIFDQVAREYATEWRLSTDSDLTIRKNRDYMMIVDLPENTKEIEIILTKWSKANSVCKVSSIKVGYTGMYTTKEIKSVQTALEDNPSLNGLKFGIAGVDGKIELYNIDSEFDTLNERGWLNDRLNVRIYGRLLEDSEDLVRVATLQTGQWVMDENSPLLSVTVKDTLEKLQEIQLVGYPLAPRTALQAFEKVFNDLGWVEGTHYVYTNLDGSYDVDNPTAATYTKNTLNSYVFPNHYGAFDNAWNLLEATCIVTMCRIYTNREGMVCVKRLF